MTNPTFRDFLPQGNEIQALQTQIQSGRMTHALLITGVDGTGKRTLARLLAAALLCQSDGQHPCGQCSSCIRAFDNEHPDLIRIERGASLAGDSRKNRTTIPVDDIREMIRLSSAFPLEGGNRVILIENADDLTPQAQNCLLKILEEPPAGNYFILTSGHPEHLLVTVRSRCRALKMRPWEDEQIIRILTDSGVEEGKARRTADSCHGSIGYAKQLAADEDYWKLREDVVSSFFRTNERSRILSVSSRWKDSKTDAEKVFDILEDCVRMMLLCRIGEKKDEKLQEFSEKWRSFAANADYSRFAFLLDRIGESRKQCEFNVNFQAVIEQLLLCFMGEI